MVAQFAAMTLGAVSLPLFAPFGSEVMEYRLRDAGAVAVAGDAAGLAKLAGPGLPALGRRIDGHWWDPTGPPATPVDTSAEEPAMMIYTSGTTGAPKGVLHAHRCLWGHLPAAGSAQEGFPVAGDVGRSPADWSRIGGMMDPAMPCLWFGVPLVAKRFARVEAGAAWDLMVAEGVTAAFLPPTAL